MHKASIKTLVKGQSSNCSFLCIRTKLLHAIHGCLKRLLNDFCTKIAIFYFTGSGKPSANNQKCRIVKVSSDSAKLSHFCWKFIYFKAVESYLWFLQIQTWDKMRALFIFQIIHRGVGIANFNMANPGSATVNSVRIGVLFKNKVHLKLFQVRCKAAPDRIFG